MRLFEGGGMGGLDCFGLEGDAMKPRAEAMVGISMI